MAAMWRYLGVAIGVLMLSVGILADETCGGLVEVNPKTCSRLMVFRIPSDGSGAYHFLLNVSMPIDSKAEMKVVLENKRAVLDGTASELVYAMSHPSCYKHPVVTSLVFNKRILCENEALKVSPEQPAVTLLSFHSTHSRMKIEKRVRRSRMSFLFPDSSAMPYNDNSDISVNNGNAFSSIPGNSGNQNGQIFNIPGTTNDNNGFFSIPGFNGRSGDAGRGSQNGFFSNIPGLNVNNGINDNFINPIFSIPGSNGNSGNSDYIGKDGNADYTDGVGEESLLENNPFLATLSSPSPSNDLESRISDSNPSNFDNNPILTGEFETLTDSAATPTERSTDVNIHYVILTNRTATPTEPPEDLTIENTTLTNPAASPTERPANVRIDIDSICGHSSLALVQGGTEVQPGEFPWLGGLFVRSARVYLCTVNLVSQQHAITAAHCFATSTDADTYGILWGHPKNGNATDRTFSRMLNLEVHPSYNRSTLHDVAVMTLLDRVTFTLVLKPICLWQSHQTSAASMHGVVAGFGPDYTDFKKINFPIVSLDTCCASNHSFHIATSEFTFCAGSKKSEEGPCKGDSGAGYMQWIDNRYYLRGLVSHSLNANGNCNLIFSDLSQEIRWVERTISLQIIL